MYENNIANNLKRLREQKGMTQGQFATYCGLYPIQISQYERGITPSIMTLEILCEALDVTATELLGF